MRSPSSSRFTSSDVPLHSPLLFPPPSRFYSADPWETKTSKTDMHMHDTPLAACPDALLGVPFRTLRGLHGPYPK